MYILSNAWTEKGERTRKRTRDQVCVIRGKITAILIIGGTMDLSTRNSYCVGHSQLSHLLTVWILCVH